MLLKTNATSLNNVKIIVFLPPVNVHLYFEFSQNYPTFGLPKRVQMLKHHLSRLFTSDEMWHGYQEIEEINSRCERTSSERIYKGLDKVHPAPSWTNFPWSLETIQLGWNKLGPLYHMKEFLWVEISFKIPLPFTVLSFVQKFLKDIIHGWNGR